jgi:hypothetical protein
MYGFGRDTVYLCPAPLYHAAPLRFDGWVHALGGTAPMSSPTDGLDSRRRVSRLLGRRPGSLGSLCEVKPTLSRPTAPGRPSPVAGDPRERS